MKKSLEKLLAEQAVVEQGSKELENKKEVKTMKQFNDVINDMLNLKGTEFENMGDLADEIIITYEDYEEDGTGEVLVELQQDNTIQAYISSVNSDIFVISYEVIENGLIKVEDVYFVKNVRK